MDVPILFMAKKGKGGLRSGAGLMRGCGVGGPSVNMNPLIVVGVCVAVCVFVGLIHHFYPA